MKDDAIAETDEMASWDNGEDKFVLQVMEESECDRINEGDFAVFDRTREVVHGSIVVILEDGATTLRRAKVALGKTSLLTLDGTKKSALATPSPIIGVLAGIVRRY